jgi:glycosyltransferase involved in cell wall biosynthesis
MKVSIITVVLNGAETIQQTIESVLNQEYRDIEYIIVDGGSADGTLDIINKYKKDVAKVISEPDNGIYEAMNKGIKLSTGEVIAFLNSNDVYADNTILRRMAEFICHNDLDAAYGDLVYVDQNNTNRATRFWKTGEYKSGAFRYGWVIPHPAFFCRRKFFKELGYFNEEFQIAADFELMLRFIEKHHIKVGYLPQTVVRMRTGGKANVLRGMIRGNWEILQSFRLNNLHLSPWFLIAKPATKISQLFKIPKG